MDNNLDRLTRGESGDVRNESDNARTYENMKNAIKDICNSMAYTTREYDPSITVALVEKFVSPENKVFRVLYSEINSWFMSLDSEKKGAFTSNAERLLLHALSLDYNNNTNIVKIIVKIYDHIQLINVQAIKTSNIFDSQIK